MAVISATGSRSQLARVTPRIELRPAARREDGRRSHVEHDRCQYDVALGDTHGGSPGCRVIDGGKLALRHDDLVTTVVPVEASPYAPIAYCGGMKRAAARSNPGTVRRWRDSVVFRNVMCAPGFW